MEREVPVKLSDEVLASKARELVTKLSVRKDLRHTLNSATKRIKGEVAAIDAQIELLRSQLEEGYEMLPQGSLFAQDLVTDDGKLPKDQAAAALGKIAEKAEASKPKPAEPHTYEGVAAEVDQCKTCDAPFMDPVHHGGDPLAEAPKASVSTQEAEQMAAAAAKLMPCPACEAKTCKAHPHAYNPSEGDPDRCTCGFAKRAKVHRVEESEASVSATEAVTPANGTETETVTTQSGATASNVVAFTPASAAEAQG